RTSGSTAHDAVATAGLRLARTVYLTVRGRVRRLIPRMPDSRGRPPNTPLALGHGLASVAGERAGALVVRGWSARAAPLRLGRHPGRRRCRLGPCGWVLARRSISDPTDIAYYRCHGPAGTRLRDLAGHRAKCVARELASGVVIASPPRPRYGRGCS